MTQPISSPAEEMTSPDLLALWLRHYASKHTQGAYARDVSRLFKFTGRPVDLLTTLDLARFSGHLIDTGLAPISRARTLTAVRSLLRFAHRAGVVAQDLADTIRLPRCDTKLAERILAEDQVRRMIDGEVDDRNRTILSLLYTSGLRVSELCGLRRRHLQSRGPTGQIIVTGKGTRTRAVLLPESIWRQLRLLTAASEAESPVFRSRSGIALDRSRVLQIVREAAQRAGITEPVSPHWLRHAHASHALDHGAPLHLVQATLGHASVATTSRYLHARPDQSSAAYIRA